MNATEIQPLFAEVQRVIGPRAGVSFQDLLNEAGLEGMDWGVLSISLDFEPETTSVKRFTSRTPYANPENYDKAFHRLAEKGLLEPAGPGEYRISKAGHAVLDHILNTYFGALGRAAFPPEAVQTVPLLERLVNACLNAPEPDKPILTYNRHSDPGPDGAAAFRLMQFFADLGAFRDDCHLAAWRPYGVSGPAWEAFTFLWRGEAHTADKLAEKLSNRGLSTEHYTQALRELEQKGWITAAGDGTYQLTEQGAALRQKVEDETDRLYYAPWAALSDRELEKLGHLLTRLKGVLSEAQAA